MVDEVTYSGWGRALSARGALSRPGSADRLTADAPAVGNRRSYGDAALNDGGVATDMTRLDRIRAFDPETGLLHAEAGVTLGDLCRLFAPRGWMPAVVPGTGFATLGGAIAMDVHGKNHHIAGSFCQHVTEITLIQGTTRTTITPAAGALWRATCGGLGQTGIIESATLQLTRTKGDMMLVTEQRAQDWDEHLEILDGSDAPYCVGWIDATAKGPALGRGIVEEADSCRGLHPKMRRARAVPLDAPRWALSKPIVKTFNAAYFHRVPASGRTTVRPMQDFFFPLDKIRDWNRLYGKRGFHQFQCVVPLTARDALRDILGRIATSGLASPLAVLKRMGEGRAGYLSFPMEGYTLAVDFPNRAEARALIEQLEGDVLRAQGRLYLAKDALSSGTAIKTMYPDHPKWAAQVEKADPQGRLQTDMTRRLSLRTLP